MIITGEGVYIAAIYDFRDKQDYICRTNNMREIMGASRLLESVYHNVLKDYAAVFSDTKNAFTVEGFVKANEQGAVLYQDGGRLALLFKNEESFKAFNRHLSWRLIDNAPGLTPICGSAEIDVNGKFREELRKVLADLGKYKRMAPPLLNDTALPITQIDRKTSMPVIYKAMNFGVLESLSAESAAKREMYRASIKPDESADGMFSGKIDDLAEEKDTEGFLAIIYVDGNGMGELAKARIPESESFETGVNLQREFTRKIDDAFVDGPIKAIKDYLKERQEKFPDKKFAMRRIIGGGDEITIVCSARHALKIARVYFDSLKKSNREQNQNYSACMGIAVFRTPATQKRVAGTTVLEGSSSPGGAHAPFAAVYEIAGQCCENGKKRMKKDGVTNACYIDAYFCNDAITGGMEDKRNQVRTCMPYSVSEGLVRFETLGKELMNVKRGNVKALRDAAFRSQAAFEAELMRVKSSCMSLAINENDRALLCDVCTFYDLWFAGEPPHGGSG